MSLEYINLNRLNPQIYCVLHYYFNTSKILIYKMDYELETKSTTLRDFISYCRSYKLTNDLDNVQICRFVCSSLLINLRNTEFYSNFQNIDPSTICFDENGELSIINTSSFSEYAKVYSPIERTSMDYFDKTSDNTDHSYKVLHRSTYLYSVGLILCDMMHDNDENLSDVLLEVKHNYIDNQFISIDWPICLQKFISSFLVLSLNKNPVFRGIASHGNPVDLMLSHPFFWSKTKIVEFMSHVGSHIQTYGCKMFKIQKELYCQNWFLDLQTTHKELFNKLKNYVNNDTCDLEFILAFQWLNSVNDETVYDLLNFKNSGDLIISCWYSIIKAAMREYPEFCRFFIPLDSPKVFLENDSDLQWAAN